MSETTVNHEQILEETPIERTYTFEEVVPIITDKYLEIARNVQEKFKYHNDLSGALEAGIRHFMDKRSSNYDQVLYNLSDNFLYCLDQLKDMNVDYFLYQVDKIKKKNGKIEKQKVSKLIGKAQMRMILKESNANLRTYICSNLTECFRLLTCRNDNGDLVFFPEYVEFVKKNLNDSKFYSKMLVSIDYVESILDENAKPMTFDEADIKNFESSDSESDSEPGFFGKSNNKKGKSGGSGFEEQFMKGLENTKIAQLAKNISEKINPEEFPLLNNPTQLLSSLSNPGGENGLGDLLKFVIGEVQGAMQSDGMNENELIQETTNLMGNFKNIAGIDPMGLFQQMAQNTSTDSNGTPQMPDMSQFAGLFNNLNETLGETLRSEVENTETNNNPKKSKK